MEGCVEIQHPPFGNNTPLFLIHDGGGTIFNYFLLGSLKRQVYGIANSHFDSGEPWEGGMHGMAREYASYIESTVSSGPIILGGWSMGGMLSLEIAHIFASHPKLEVKGIVMIDSPYPKTPDPEGQELVASDPEFAPTTKQEVRDKILRSMKECRLLIHGWQLPTWGGGRSPPPAVMLRAKEFTKPTGTASLSRTDLARNDKFLGWKEYPYEFIEESHDIPGAHFSVFRPHYVSSQVRDRGA
ncbi:alpha/beta-hydrolase [Myriangium duriaei CBS 260.36]|uniref:Alpha/beta-hydrolase n=1 Tax=Myriangium duriaei CBS 260.36 TaxID=1168546 RepID=A0A9P4MBK5_9PEZI|nr:alpha/beta-hydrolase [Myriangium duriaei CBS 260.36]